MPMMPRFVLATMLALGAALAFAQDAAENPVEVRLEIFLVSEVQGKEQLRPATSARPGQVVEYRLTALNRSEETLPSGTVEIIGPIPPRTAYVANSAKPSSERILTEYSADGGETFSEEPVLVGDEDDRRVVEPENYDAVRWMLLIPMEPGQEESFFYRVTVE